MLFDNDLPTTDPYRQALDKAYRLNEQTAIDQLLPIAALTATSKSRIWDRARKLVDYIRLDSKGNHGVDALLREFSLSSDEGVVLMCLAEALLRVPDKHTQDCLIKDKISKGLWSSHLGNSHSLFVNASSWGLLLTGKIVNYRHAKTGDQMKLLKNTIGILGEPVIRRAVHFAMHVMGNQFVTGKTIKEALTRTIETKGNDNRYSFDMLGEAARTMQDANHYFDSYLEAIHAIGAKANPEQSTENPGISVKLSALHPRYSFSHRDRVMSELVPRLKLLALAAKRYNIGFTVDAEEADRLDLSLDVIEAVFTDKELDQWEGFGLAVQAYQKRALPLIDWLKQLSIKTHKKLRIRLVKGAYWDSEIKHAQQQGMSDFPVFTRKAATDVSYIAVAAKLLAEREHFYLQFATHNAYTVSTLIEMAGPYQGDFEFQRLHGMGESLFRKVYSDHKIPCRVYAPVGEHESLLAYLVRRLLENGANSSFVNSILDDSVSLDTLLYDPYDKITALKEKRNPNIALPANILGSDRINSQGLDISDIAVLQPLKHALDNCEKSLLQQSVPLTPEATPIVNPANLDETLGYITKTDKQSLPDLITKAEQVSSDWRDKPVTERAALLFKLADLLEKNRDELITLCIKEAGKVLQDAVDEIREAVDFCRYYAVQAQNDDYSGSNPRGIILCISPWNFPVAIFLGQISAALVMGNVVLAKPAEQTVLIAQRTVELMHEAGIPEQAVQLLIASGKDVGEQVVTDQRIKAVMFTGSTATGQTISKTLAQRPGFQVPLIAETGGQNCMLVDSTALLEQVVDDVIASGFQSAGQRCSALRVLYVQADIADKLIELLVGAMKELTISDPQWLATDIGPVIDAKALASLESHVDYIKGQSTLLYQCKIQPLSAAHYFFAPRLYEIDDIHVLTKEVFGPCVHLIRFDGNNIDKVINDINHTGYGLTMGIHSRIEERTIDVANRINAGNIYINRNMIGAVVGVQPFGGRGLSGTGPKAGGPNYLGRLVQDSPEPNDNKRYDDTAACKAVTSSHISDDQTDTVNQLFQAAQDTQVRWQQTPLSERVLFARELAATLANSQQVKALDLNLEDTLALINKQLHFIANHFDKAITLPGPTGESNQLHYEARGCILNYANSETSFLHWMTSLLTAAVLGNTVITIVSDRFHEEAATILQSLEKQQGSQGNVIQLAKKEDLPATLKHTALNAVIISTECKVTSAINQILADRDGAIIPVMNAASKRLPVQLLLEKTITIDTTASGGNTALMAIEA